MSNEQLITGGCACGKIRYEFSGEPIVSVNCHCRQCQRASGSAYAAAMVIWQASLKWLSEPPSYYSRDPDDDFYLQRGFCGACGSPVSMQRPERPKLAYLLAGSLDKPELYRPTMDIFTDEAHRWDAMDQNLDKFVGMPPMPDDLGR